MPERTLKEKESDGIINDDFVRESFGLPAKEGSDKSVEGEKDKQEQEEKEQPGTESEQNKPNKLFYEIEARGGKEKVEIPENFYIKNEDGDIDETKTLVNVAKSYLHLNTKLGQMGKELGDLRKELVKAKTDLAEKQKAPEPTGEDVIRSFSEGKVDEFLDKLMDKMERKRASKEKTPPKESENAGDDHVPEGSKDNPVEIIASWMSENSGESEFFEKMRALENEWLAEDQDGTVREFYSDTKAYMDKLLSSTKQRYLKPDGKMPPQIKGKADQKPSRKASDNAIAGVAEAFGISPEAYKKRYDEYKKE